MIKTNGLTNGLEILQYLNGVWKDIIIKHSNDTYYDIRPHLRDALDNIIEWYNVKFDKNKSISMQLDKPIVTRMLELASELDDIETIDDIYKRTRASLFNYFYHKQIVEAYLAVDQERKAYQVIEYMLDKNHIAYWYAILIYDVNNYKNHPAFCKSLISLRTMAKIKLIANGEAVDLTKVTFNDLKTIMQAVELYKSGNKIVIIQ